MHDSPPQLYNPNNIHASSPKWYPNSLSSKNNICRETVDEMIWKKWTHLLQNQPTLEEDMNC